MMAENNVMVSKKSKTKTPKPTALHFAIRIRGAPGMKRTILDSLKMLRMHKCKDYIAYGEIDEKTLLRLLRTRGKVEGNKPLTDEHIKNLTKYKDLKEFSKALLSGEIKYRTQDVYKIKPVFRLHPPRKGHRGTIKRHYNEGGTLGYVDQFINVMLHKMM